MVLGYGYGGGGEETVQQPLGWPTSMTPHASAQQQLPPGWMGAPPQLAAGAWMQAASSPDHPGRVGLAKSAAMPALGSRLNAPGPGHSQQGCAPGFVMDASRMVYGGPHPMGVMPGAYQGQMPGPSVRLPGHRGSSSSMSSMSQWTQRSQQQQQQLMYQQQQQQQQQVSPQPQQQQQQQQMRANTQAEVQAKQTSSQTKPSCSSGQQLTSGSSQHVSHMHETFSTSKALSSRTNPTVDSESMPPPPPNKAQAMCSRIGSRTYAAVRCVMLQQQSTFVQHLFELHKLAQVQFLLQSELEACAAADDAATCASGAATDAAVVDVPRQPTDPVSLHMRMSRMGCLPHTMRVIAKRAANVPAQTATSPQSGARPKQVPAPEGVQRPTALYLMQGYPNPETSVQPTVQQADGSGSGSGGSEQMHGNGTEGQGSDPGSGEGSGNGQGSDQGDGSGDGSGGDGSGADGSGNGQGSGRVQDGGRSQFVGRPGGFQPTAEFHSLVGSAWRYKPAAGKDVPRSHAAPAGSAKAAAPPQPQDGGQLGTDAGTSARCAGSDSSSAGTAGGSGAPARPTSLCAVDGAAKAALGVAAAADNAAAAALPPTSSSGMQAAWVARHFGGAAAAAAANGGDVGTSPNNDVPDGQDRMVRWWKDARSTFGEPAADAPPVRCVCEQAQGLLWALGVGV